MHIDVGELRRRRLRAQRIDPPLGSSVSIGAVVRHMLAMQAQDFAQATWAVGLRSPGCTQADVLMALERGEVVRSWPMRGTLHFVAPADLRWMLQLTAPRTLRGLTKRHSDLGLDEEVFARSADVARGALGNGGRLSRDGFYDALHGGGISTDGQRGYHIIGMLAHQGLICWGPPVGNQQALVLLDEWAPAPDAPDRDEALRRFAVGYYSAHGPATLKDFVWWTKLTQADAKRGIALARTDLVEVNSQGVMYWLSAIEADAGIPSERLSAAVLPGFDEYLLGYQDRSAVLAAEFAPRIVPGNNGIFLPMVLASGEIVGTWRRSAARTKVEVQLRMFRDVTATEQGAIAAAASDYSRFRHTPTV